MQVEACSIVTMTVNNNLSVITNNPVLPDTAGHHFLYKNQI